MPQTTTPLIRRVRIDYSSGMLFWLQELFGWSYVENVLRVCNTVPEDTQ